MTLFETGLLALLALLGNLGSSGHWAAVAALADCGGACRQTVTDAHEEEEGALLQTKVVSGFSARRVGVKSAKSSRAPMVAALQENATGHWPRSEAPVVSALGPWPSSAGVSAAKGAKLARAAWLLGCLLALCVMLVLMGVVSSWKGANPSSPPSSQPAPATPPPPAPRLSQCRTSFVIPATRLKRANTSTFSFDIPVWPVVWPFRASFWRPSGQGRWEMFEITVDVTAAIGIPPLLSCRISDDVPETEGHLQLVIQNTSGALVATMNQVADGFVVQREGQPEMQVEAHDDVPWGVVIRKHGQDIGVATSIGSGKQDSTAADSEEYLQLDVQPDSESPEAALLLTCMLASIVFGPGLPDKGG